MNGSNQEMRSTEAPHIHRLRYTILGMLTSMIVELNLQCNSCDTLYNANAECVGILDDKHIHSDRIISMEATR